MTYTAARHQGANEVFCLRSGGAVMSFTFMYNHWYRPQLFLLPDDFLGISASLAETGLQQSAVFK